jgi:hypothetical protein
MKRPGRSEENPGPTGPALDFSAVLLVAVVVVLIVWMTADLWLH